MEAKETFTLLTGTYHVYKILHDLSLPSSLLLSSAALPTPFCAFCFTCTGLHTRTLLPDVVICCSVTDHPTLRGGDSSTHLLSHSSCVEWVQLGWFTCPTWCWLQSPGGATSRKKVDVPFQRQSGRKDSLLLQGGQSFSFMQAFN